LSRAALFNGLADAGHEIVVAAPITATDLAAGDSFAAMNPKLRVVRYLVDAYSYGNANVTSDETGTWSREAAAFAELLPRAIDGFRPDVMLIGREDQAPPVTAIAKRHHLPAVLMARGLVANIVHGPYEPVLRDRFLNSFREVDAIVTVADHLTEGLRELGLEHVRTAPNSIDRCEFHPVAPDAKLLSEEDLDAGSPIVMCVGGLRPVKRPLDVIEAARLLQQERSDVTLVFCGDGPLEQQCREQVAASGIDNQVRFAGWIDYGRMPGVLSAASVVVLASESEGLSRALLEAMASERCVVASDIPASREVIGDGENGLLFGIGNPADLATKLLTALGDGELRARLGQAARASTAWRSIESGVGIHIDAMQDAIARFRERTGPC